MISAASRGVGQRFAGLLVKAAENPPTNASAKKMDKSRFLVADQLAARIRHMVMMGVRPIPVNSQITQSAVRNILQIVDVLD